MLRWLGFVSCCGSAGWFRACMADWCWLFVVLIVGFGRIWLVVYVW